MSSKTLTGQRIIGGRSVNAGFDRISHYEKHAEFNAAALSFGGPHEPSELARKFKAYREAWGTQPLNWSNAISSGEHSCTQFWPLSLDIELAAVCDLACPYCYRQALVTPDKIMKPALARKLITEAAEMHVPSIKLNWRGEPLLHPKIFDLIRYAKSRGIIDVIANTNATQLDASKIDLLLESGIDYLIFSFDGGTKATYEKNRIGRFSENTFERVIDNIRNFCKRKDELNKKFPWTRVQMVLTADAIHEQGEYLDLFNEYVDEVCVNNYDERGMGANQLSGKDKEIFIEKTTLNNLSPESHFMKVDSEEVLVSAGRKPCDQPFQRMLVTYDGRVSMCCFDWGSRHTIGYVHDAAFTDSDYDKKRVEQLIAKRAKGFELMNEARMPEQLYSCYPEVKSLKEIWVDQAVSQIRTGQSLGTCDTTICKSCTYRGSHTWI